MFEAQSKLMDRSLVTHEAGHAVAAWALGWRVDRLFVPSWCYGGNETGLVTYRSDKTMPLKHLTVLAAGCQAETLVCGRKPKGQSDVDFRNACDVLREARRAGIFIPPHPIRRAIFDAEHLLKRHEEELRRLADAACDALPVGGTVEFDTAKIMHCLGSEPRHPRI